MISPLDHINMQEKVLWDGEESVLCWGKR